MTSCTLRAFDDEKGKTYLAIEFIRLVQAPPSDLRKGIEDALTWLSTLSAPPGHKLEPLGGGCFWHDIFDGEAPLPFKDFDALKLFLEEARTRLVEHGKDLNPVSFVGERLMCTQANMDDSHFGVDEEGNTVMLGFRNISFLPETFAWYTLTQLTQLDNDRFAALLDTLGWSGSANMETMVEIAANLAMSGNPSLGLNEFGKSKTAKKRVRKGKGSDRLQVGVGK